MKRKLFSILLRAGIIVPILLPAASLRAQVATPPWLAAIAAGGGFYENGSGIRAGSNGMIYTSGRYAGSINLNGAIPPAATGATDGYSAGLSSALGGAWGTKVHTSGGYDYVFGFNIDPSNNTYSVGTVNSGGSSFVTKTNSAGAVQWGINIGAFNSGAHGVCADAAGNVYVCGDFSATMNFGTGNLAYAGGGSDIFIAKFNSAGTIQWSIRCGGTGYDAAKACEVDAAGNLYVVGGYTGTATFGSITAPASGTYSNLYVAKFDVNTGACLSVTTAVNAGIVNGGWYEENDLALDSCGNIYVAGHFKGAASFGSFTFNSVSNSDDVFVAKINPAGVFQWVRTGGSSAGDQAFGVALDKNWDVLVSGHFTGAAMFGTTSITPVGNNDVFVAKYSSGNGDLMYVQKGGGMGYEDAYGGVTADANRQVYVTGGFSDNNIGANTTSFGSFNLGNGYYGNIYVAKLDSTPDLRILPQQQPAYCAGNCYSLPYTAIGTFNPGNTFTLEISDATGSFASGGTTLGTFTSTASGTISFCIPAGFSAGSNYLLRVRSSSPAYSSIVRCTPITISAAPTVSVTGNATICSGGDTLLTASGASTYAWTPLTGLSSGTGASVTANPATTTTYSVIGTNVAGCSDTAVTTITVSSSSAPVITGNDSICAGSSTTLTASGSGTFAWSSGGTAASETVSPAVTTTYSVTVSDVNGCTGMDSVTVTVNNLPTAGISGTTNICAGNSTTLTASGGGTYAWSSGGSATAETVSPASTTSYTVTITDGNGCTDTASATVTVNPQPAPSISGSTTICAGQSTTLTASGSGTFSWSSGGTNASETLSPSATTSYTVTLTDVNGCSGIDSATVIVNALPAPAISGNTTICAGASTTLTASGSGSFSWSSGGTSASETLSPATTTSYTVTLTDGNGCSGVDSATVTVNPLPAATISGGGPICAGQSATLTAGGGGTYAWSSGGSSASETVTPTSTTTYTVTVTDTNGCTDTASATVTVNPLPNATISGSTSICNGQSTTLTAGGSGAYQWSTGATSASITVTPAGNTSYTLVVTDPLSGCTSSSSVQVTVLSQPIASVTGDTSICAGSTTLLTASGGSSFTWSTGQSSGSISAAPATSTTYSVIVSNGACADTASIQVTVNALPAVNAGSSQTIAWGTSTTLNAAAPPGTTLTWSPSSGLSCTSCANPEASPSSTTTYCVLATDAAGCSDSSCVTIYVDITCGEIFVPNAFSPNNDGKNEVLTVEGNCITEMLFQVFDRWGEKVFESVDKNVGWDGFFRSNPAQTGVYIYQLNATLVNGEQVQKKGNISLIR